MSRFLSHLKQRQLSIEEPTVNLTPLIDVVFVILIMFILVAPLLELDRVQLAQAPSHPVKESISVQETSPIALHVQRDNTIYFNKQKIQPKQIVPLLKQAKQKYPKAPLQLFHDKQGQFGTYQMIKNAAEEAGFTEMDIVLQP